MVLLYDRTSSQECVNQARKFTQKGRAIDGLPPTQAALIQHIKRAAYHAGHCWAREFQSFHLKVNGWIKKDEGGLEICWTTLPEANKCVGNLYVVAVRRAAEGTASARRLLCSALLLVTAVDFALTDK